MNIFLKSIALCFSCGSLGGLTNSLAVWVFGALGITALFGVSIAPALSPDWLYPRIVWGGLWGFLLFAPFFRGSPYIRGILWSLGPSAVQLLLIFPFVKDKGFFGLELGFMTPVFVVVFNAIWGITAAVLLERLNREPENAR